MEFLKIMMTINNLKISSYEELKKQIGGMYGENYANLFEKKEEFDMQKALKELSEYNYEQVEEKISYEEKDYLDFDNWDLFVAKQIKEQVKYFKDKEKGYLKIEEQIIEIYDEELLKELKIKKCKISEIFNFPIIKYKYVQKQKDGYFSYYDENFEYKIGEKAISKGNRGLFVLDKDELEYSTFSNKDDKVLIKCAIENLEDLLKLDDLREVKSFKVVEEVNENEI